MLNWEDYHREESAGTPAAVAAAAAQEQPAQPAPPVAVAPQATAAEEPPPIEANEKIAEAARAVEKLDVAQGLEELEMGAARVSVD
ncbi:ribonucleotide-diphosphate reductase subunit beta, partial [Halieaceae bacterium]|nr:ribonucleotide-diphosphate reductase subunit beta [Halieaceae bacterium]